MKYGLTPGLALAGLLAALTACTTKPAYYHSQADPRYAKVALAQWGKQAEAEDGTIRVLLVHGMADHPFGKEGGESMTKISPPQLGGYPTYDALAEAMTSWDSQDVAWRAKMVGYAIDSHFNGFADKLSKGLGKYRELEDHEFRIVREPKNGRAVGYTLTRTFVPKRAGDPPLKMYVVNWSLASAPAKEARFGSWNNLGTEHGAKIEGEVGDLAPDLVSKRATLNNYLKLNIINWGFGDAMLLGSEYGDLFRRATATGMKQLIDESGPEDRFVLVAASLGSTIALDTLTAFLNNDSPGATYAWSWGDRADEGRRLMMAPANGNDRAKIAVYLFANQYAMLTLGRNYEGAAGSPNSSLVALDNAVRRVNPGSTVQIYAFTDPNDELSFAMNPNLQNVSTCNVYVKNREGAIGNLVVHPGDAHLNYETNPHVVHTILHGPPDQ